MCAFVRFCVFICQLKKKEIFPLFVQMYLHFSRNKYFMVIVIIIYKFAYIKVEQLIHINTWMYNICDICDNICRECTIYLKIKLLVWLNFILSHSISVLLFHRCFWDYSPNQWFRSWYNYNETHRKLFRLLPLFDNSGATTVPYFYRIVHNIHHIYRSTPTGP